MKKVLFFTISLMSAINLLAQNVGIGTNTPDASAKLDVVDSNRGLLIPRVALTATNAPGPVTSPATSLLVYNTDTAGTAPYNVWPGYYYWDGTEWVRLDTDNDEWKLDGNTNGALRYIGTNDNYDFPIRTDGTEKMRVTTAGNVGIGTTAPDASAILDISSTTKGVLLPRMTTAQRDAIPVSSARQGLLIYNTDRNCFEFFDTKADPVGLGGFWNSLCELCDQVVVISSNQTGFDLNSYLGGSKAIHYCVYIQTGVTLQAAGNGGGPGAAGNPGFNATTMVNGAKVTLYNRGNILAGGGNGGQGGNNNSPTCGTSFNASSGGAGGHAIVTNSSVPITVYNYGIIRAGGGGGGAGAGGCCSAGGGGGGGAGTPAGAGGPGRTFNCQISSPCGFCWGGTSSGGNPGTPLAGGTGGAGACTPPPPGCSYTTSTGCGGNGGNGGNPGAWGQSGINGSICNNVNGSGGGPGLALQGNGSLSSLINVSGTVNGGVNP